MRKPQEQFVPFIEAVKALQRLCMERRSGTMYIRTDEEHGAAMSLMQGKIVDIYYRTTRGIKALPLMRDVKKVSYFFKSDQRLRDKPIKEDEKLPANEVIFNEFGLQAIPTVISSPGKKIHKILVVEDSAMARKVVVQTLAGKGYQIIEAKDGNEALSKLAADKPDLVLLDLILPGMDGYQVLDAMKADPNLKKIPVIVLTSRDALFDKLKGMMSGTDEYMTKPVVPDKLLSKVEKYLR